MKSESGSMIEAMFPAKKNRNMSDEAWIDYCITVWCCNSLNAEAGNYRKKDPYIADLLLRAQAVIMYLRDRKEKQ